MSAKFICLGLIAGCFAAASGARDAYLPIMGPAPLRFRVAPAFVASVAVWPPLQMTDVTANPTVTTSNLPPLAPSPKATEPLKTLLPLKPLTNDAPAVVAPAETTSGAVVVPGEQPSVLTPQMLVDFFRKAGLGSNAPASSGSGTFTPPLPSSSATYKTN